MSFYTLLHSSDFSFIQSLHNFFKAIGRPHRYIPNNHGNPIMVSLLAVNPYPQTLTHYLVGQDTYE